jgi:DNA repair protein RecO (recombination protein O)
MEWSDDAIVLAMRPHGETSAILDVLTQSHGRHLGMVRGGGSRRAKPALQAGNSLHVSWRARLSEHLGNFHVEPLRARAGVLFESRDRLIGLHALAAVAQLVLPDRQPHRPVYEAGEILLDAMLDDGFSHWAPLYVRWETGLLEELGFGLDLSRCAATGTVEDLRYISPKSGRAVSGAAGAPYRDRLFPLPRFLLGAQNGLPDLVEIAAGLRMTAHFLLERALRPNGRELPAARQRLEALALQQTESD